MATQYGCATAEVQSGHTSHTIAVEQSPELSAQAHGFLTCTTIDTEIKAKRNNMISELLTFRITKANAKAKCEVKYQCGRECERSSAQLISIRKRERRNMFGELISL